MNPETIDSYAMLGIGLAAGFILGCLSLTLFLNWLSRKDVAPRKGRNYP